ncbi:MAG TPA: hypothetical protein VL418_18615 [Devosiaceae bacterium]|nr:hypothetical protein [Devosiaceae bacterium]
MTEYLLKAGEPAPWFSSARLNNDHDRVPLDELAGPHIVLLFFRNGSQSGVLQALQTFGISDDLFDGRQAIFMGLSREPDELTMEFAQQSGAGRYFLRDGGGAIARLYGLAVPQTVGDDNFGPVAFILTPALQVADILPLDRSGTGAESVVSILRQRLASPVAVQSPPVLVVPRVFDREFCDRLIEQHQASGGGREIGVVESDGKAIGGQFDPNFRKRSDWYISDEAMIGEARDQIVRRLLPMVYRAFQFRTTRIERYLVGCYDSATGGRFAAHRDNTAPPVAHRRFALTINLNEDYEGGYLRFPEFGRQNHRAAPGDAIVFSCSLLHEVTPITRDRRFAFVSFLYDEQSQQLRDDYAKRVAEQQKA